MTQTIFGGVRYQPYEQVYNAIADLGGSIRQGMRDVSDAKESAADFVLKGAKVRADLKRQEVEMPGMLAKAREATNYLDQQNQLDQPMTTAKLSNSILGANPSESVLNHFFADDIPGALLKTLGATYNKETDTYHSNTGKVITERDFMEAGPMIQATIVSKTDPLYMAQDMLEEARKAKDHAKVSELEKQIKDPKWMVEQYDKQAQYLINAKAAFVKSGYDTTGINESLSRIYKRQESIGDLMELDKRLRLKGDTLKPQITQKDIANLYMKAYEQVDKLMESRAALGDFKDWTPDKLSGYRRNQAATRVRDSLEAAGVLKVSEGGPGSGAGIDPNKYKGKGKKDTGAFKKALNFLTDKPDEDAKKLAIESSKEPDTYKGFRDYGSKYRFRGDKKRNRPKTDKKINLKKVKEHRRDRIR